MAFNDFLCNVRNGIKADEVPPLGQIISNRKQEALMGSKSGGRSTSYLLRRSKKAIQGGVENGEHLAVLEALNLPVSLINRQYTYTWVNSCYSAAHGKSQEEIVGRKVPALWGKENFAGGIKSNWTGVSRVSRYATKPGSFSLPLVPVTAVVYSPYRPDGRRVASVAVITYDIDDRKRMERKLKAHEERLERLVKERTEELRKSEKTFRNIFENATKEFFRLRPRAIF